MSAETEISAAAVILYRTAEFLGNKTIINSPNHKVYADETDISDWAITIMLRLYECG